MSYKFHKKASVCGLTVQVIPNYTFIAVTTGLIK